MKGGENPITTAGLTEFAPAGVLVAVRSSFAS